LKLRASSAALHPPNAKLDVRHVRLQPPRAGSWKLLVNAVENPPSRERLIEVPEIQDKAEALRYI
jgi:hypothetical protein